MASALALGTAGCIPFPAPVTYVVTPAVHGRLVNLDDAPVAGAAVAVSTSAGGVCSSPLAQTRTDARGIFRFSRREEKRWAVPLMENFGVVPYRLCIGRIDSTGNAVYVAGARVAGRMSGDWQDCVEWQWHGVPQLACGHREGSRGIDEFGDWADGGEAGWYRVLPVVVPGASRNPAQLTVQWLERSSSDGRTMVRAQADLPVDPSEIDLRTFGFAPVLAADRWCLSIPSAERSFWSGTKWLNVAIGSPGQLLAARALNAPCPAAVNAEH